MAPPRASACPTRSRSLPLSGPVLKQDATACNVVAAGPSIVAESNVKWDVATMPQALTMRSSMWMEPVVGDLVSPLSAAPAAGVEPGSWGVASRSVALFASTAPLVAHAGTARSSPASKRHELDRNMAMPQIQGKEIGVGVTLTISLTWVNI